MSNLVECPVCNGTKMQRHERYGLRACANCGGQYMSGRATGVVATRPDGEACRHSYAYQNLGRCLSQYTCKLCGDKYVIDSGD